MKCKVISCVEKIFPDGRGAEISLSRLSALQGECVSFQAAFLAEKEDPLYAWYQVESPLKEYITVRRVESVPARIRRTLENSDENYLSLEPGMYPDLLIDLHERAFVTPHNEWRSLYVETEGPSDLPAGLYPISVHFMNAQNEILCTAETELEVIGAKLPEQKITHTEWFYTDCLADFYQVPSFSEKHWEIIERFVKTAVKRGVTMLLTPHFTPPLDTWVGGERTTVQLMGVKMENGEYSFDFANLKRWVDMALACGVKKFEFAHLFTQWGSKAAPKVMAVKDGVYQRIFGWDTPATGGEYTRFLNVYLPALTEKLREWGIQDRCYFHVSDEPSMENMEYYKAAADSVKELLKDFPIMDAMSHYPIYAESNVQVAVVSISHLEEFVEKKADPLWGYYCCGPTKVMTNRFLQMPLHRTRALGLQMWKYNLQGFLHWGFNFYNTVHSVNVIDPHLDTEAGGYFPAGDGFLVYPGRDGKPEESLRLLAMHQAFQDARALSLLESLIGREKVLEIVDEEEKLSLTQYPRTGEKLLSVREKVNAAIKEALNA